VLIGEQPRYAAGLRRGQLLGVAGEQDLRAVPGGDRLDRGQVVSGHHRRLVDNQQVTRPDRKMAAGLIAVLDPAQEGREVVTLGEAFGGERMSRVRGRGQADDVTDTGVSPGLGDRGDRSCLPRAGGPDQDVDGPARG
jgi:hypothetical protein